ncbi:MAG: uridine kinase, partial [Cutibacterium acnes]
VPEYDPQTCRRKGVRRVAPADVILVEGILLFYDPALRDLFDMKVRPSACCLLMK